MTYYKLTWATGIGIPIAADISRMSDERPDSSP